MGRIYLWPLLFLTSTHSRLLLNQYKLLSTKIFNASFPTMAKKEKPPEKVGGLVFFLSLFFLLILNGLLILLVPTIFSGDHLFRNWTYFVLGSALGYVSSSLLIRGRLAVFFHELNHKVLSGLLGNKPKKLKVGQDDGFFEYEYTKETAPYNAFISLAPYFFPLFTLFTLIIAMVNWRSVHHIAVLITGLGYGADLYLNTRTISPHQSDFSQLNGGYFVGILYVILISAAIFFFLASWVSDGAVGIAHLFKTMLQIFAALVEIFSGVQITIP